MKCEETAEFVSALFDGERIPREAAEHAGACETCRTRLKEYAEIGVELRRVASLESPEETRARTWERRHSIRLNWWRKGWGTMRIPRLAFALLLVTIVVLGSSLVLVKARAHGRGQVLMLTIDAPGGESDRCPLMTAAEKSSPGCIISQGGKSGMLTSSFRVTAMDGDRIELGVRSKFTPSQPDRDGKTYSTSVSIKDLESWPETQYLFEPGQKLEIGIAGFGTLVVTGELMDYMPSIVASSDEQLDPKQDELRVVSPVLLRDKKVAFEFEGAFATADKKKNQCVFMYIAPPGGRYVLSLLPMEGAVEGRIQQSRIYFAMNSVSYEFLMAAPIARTEHVWILHQPNYRPSQEVPEPRNVSTSAIGTADLSHIGVKAPAKN
jgi:hypothetical protein